MNDRPAPMRAYVELFDASPNPALLAGPDFRIVDANQACVEFTGYSREELRGKLPEVLFTNPEPFEEAISAFAAGETWRGTFELEARDGRFKYGQGIGAPIQDGEEIVGYFGIFVDATRLRRYEQTLNIFSRVFRHNLRNDASVVLGYLELLREHVDSPEALSAATYVEHRVRTLLDRAETARRLESVLDAGGEDLGPVALDEVIPDAVERTAEQFPEATFRTDPIPSVAVAADDAIPEVLSAVLENAVVHNDVDRPVVEVSVETDLGSDQVLVTVADNGPGIDADEVPAALGDREASQLEHGAGLDLFFVSCVMNEYSGRLDIRDNHPRGAVVELRFRRVDRP
ncbi:PAS domain S-box protein [Halorarum halophilum]|uniref:histidine kinase n=1 Tax=Halorarum halophilum TaxID=2743090 RepID=A0A7D5K6L9_9EURY|nr:PAS domain S-box protein [Halobaculum halophilum]QLG26859.1 PAS domain S-box protein [Halobaculum halophilum]